MNEPLDLSGNTKQPNGSGTPSRVEKLQQKLYAQDAHFEMRPRKEMLTKKFVLEDDWKHESHNDFAKAVEKPGLSLFGKIAIGAFVFFIAAMGYAYFALLNNGPQYARSNVDVRVISPVAIGGGEELLLDIIIENRHNVPMQTVDLVIEYPEGTKSYSDLSLDVQRFRKGLGDINPNTTVKETQSVALFGEEGSVQEIKVRVEYRLPNSTAIFQQEKPVTLSLQSSPVRLFVETVRETTSSQEMTFDITVASNSNQDLQNVLVQAQYPFGFSVVESTLKQTYGNNTWLFETLKPQESISFKLTGRLEGQNREERVFRWNAGIANEEEPQQLGVTFTSIPKSVTITQPFLALELSLDGALDNEVVRSGQTAIEGRLVYFNNTGAAINDGRIILKLNGDVLDPNSVQVTNGFFSSADNTITWDASSNSSLQQIPIGGRETLLFRFASKPLATRNAVFKNPEIIMDATVSGRRLSEDGVSDTLQSSIVKRLRFSSGVALRALTSYAGEPFQNSGPIPPRAGQETTYTITLDVTNTSNAIENGVVTARLPSYVRWNNLVTPAQENITFDPVTRIVRWELGDVREHAGFIDPSRTVAFQVTLTPSISQVGNTPSLLTTPAFEGTDTFTSTIVTTTSREPNTDSGGRADLTDSKVVN